VRLSLHLGHVPRTDDARDVLLAWCYPQAVPY
jgi:hypothetical protein